MAPARRCPGLRGALPWLTLVLLCGCGHFQSSDAAPSLRPVIIIPPKPVKNLVLGEHFSLSCQARSPFPRMNLIYWLANGSFVEDQYRDRAVSEGDVVQESRDAGVLLTRELHFRSFSRRDWSTSFMCVTKNPAGLDKALVHWGPERPAQGSRRCRRQGRTVRPRRAPTLWTGPRARTEGGDSSAGPAKRHGPGTAMPASLHD